MDLTFGKHAGEPLSELPDGYLAWLHLKCEQVQRDPTLAVAVEQEWHARGSPEIAFDDAPQDAPGGAHDRMKGFHDLGLAGWVRNYCADKLEKNRKKVAKVEQLESVWDGMKEGDWEAWRELMILRPRARNLLSESVIGTAVARKVAQQAVSSEFAYSPPYSFGLEVAALRELLR
jgi:hypothetical protein